uniref:Uncharacterized protein n=1 Tax=Panagrolaimus sp. JU765 TaxID=591449 RepID=A0AC34QU72_9BILA
MSSSLTIVKLAHALSDEDAQLEYLLGTLKYIESNVNESDSGRLCKALSGEIVKSFSNSPLFQADVRAFEIWKYLAKYSSNLGYGKVMDNIYKLGFFQELVEYYESWAEYEMKQGNMTKVQEIEGYAMTNCRDKRRVIDIFKNWAGADETENILMNIRGVEKREKPVVTPLKKPLSVVNEDSHKIEGGDNDDTFIDERKEELPATHFDDGTFVVKRNKEPPATHLNDATFVVQRNKAPPETQLNDATFVVGRNEKPPATYFIKNDVETSPLPQEMSVLEESPKDLYEQTSPLSQEPQHFSTISTLKESSKDLYEQTLPSPQEPQHFSTSFSLKESPKAPEVEKDFSIFEDEDDSNAGEVLRSFVEESVVSESVMPKHPKPKNNVDDSVDFDKVFGTMALEKLVSPELNKMTTPMIADEKTVAGYGKYGSTMISTPIKGGIRPTFEVSPTQTFTFGQEKQDEDDPEVSHVKPFVFSMVPDAEKLKRK